MPQRSKQVQDAYLVLQADFLHPLREEPGQPRALVDRAFRLDDWANQLYPVFYLELGVAAAAAIAVKFDSDTMNRLHAEDVERGFTAMVIIKQDEIMKATKAFWHKPP